MSEVSIITTADLEDPMHRRGIVELLNRYALEPHIGGVPLSAEVQENLVPRLQEQANGRYFVALNDAGVTGIALCFLGFSTFRAMPLLNLHDLAVHPEHRGLGIGARLLRAVEDEAKELGCCSITLEVNEINRARRLYERFGFDESGADGRTTLFMVKRLPST